MATPYALPLRNLVRVDIDYGPQYLARDLFNTFMIVGSGVNTRGTLRGVYTSVEGVADHYAITTNEYKMAVKHFAQIPRPRTLSIATIDGIVYPSAV